MSSPRNGGLTIKQKKFVSRVIATGNPTQAVLEVYDTTKQDVARSMASENLAKPSIYDAIEKGLKEEGLTPNTVIAALKDNLLSGKGVKSTAADSNTAAKLLLQTFERLESKRTGGSFGITVSVDGLSKYDLIQARQKLTAKWNDILGA